MKKLLLTFIAILFIGCSTEDNGGSSENISFDKMYLFDGYVYDETTFYFLGQSLYIDELDGLQYLYGNGWVLEVEISANFNSNDLAEEGVYTPDRYNSIPFTINEVALYQYNSNEYYLNGAFYLMSDAMGSYFKISYESNIMNIEYSLKLRDSENSVQAVDFILEGKWSENINDINKVVDEIELFPN